MSKFFGVPYEIRRGFVEVLPKDVRRAEIRCPECGHKWKGAKRQYYTCRKCGYRWRDY